MANPRTFRAWAFLILLCLNARRSKAQLTVELSTIIPDIPALLQREPLANQTTNRLSAEMALILKGKFTIDGTAITDAKISELAHRLAPEQIIAIQTAMQQKGLLASAAKGREHFLLAPGASHGDETTVNETTVAATPKPNVAPEPNNLLNSLNLGLPNANTDTDNFIYRGKIVVPGSQIEIGVDKNQPTIATVLALKGKMAKVSFRNSTGDKVTNDLDISKFLQTAYYYKNQLVSVGTVMDIQVGGLNTSGTIKSIQNGTAQIEYRDSKGALAEQSVSLAGLPNRPKSGTLIGEKVGGVKAPQAIITGYGQSPDTFNGVPLTEITAPNGSKIRSKFFTAQGSEYIISDDHQVRRIKSANHTNTQDDESGLMPWMDRGIFLKGKNAKFFNGAVNSIFDNYKGRVTIMYQNGKAILMGFENQQWRALTWKDAFPKFTNWRTEATPIGPEGTIAMEYGDTPSVGDQMLEISFDKDGFVQSFHPGSPVSFVEGRR